jgi:hypothetical protein
MSAKVDASVSARAAVVGQRFGITGVEVRGFRTARNVSFWPGPVCALVGEADAGKSNLLAAIRAVLDPEAAPLTSLDMAHDGNGEVLIRITLANGGEASLERGPDQEAKMKTDEAPPVLFLPAEARAGSILPGGTASGDRAREAVEIFQQALGRRRGVSAGRALSLVGALEVCCAHRVADLLLLVEEPELYLRPQAQRYLYRLLREFALGGNQVIYSTHSPAFLNVTRLDELVFVERLPEAGTRALQPEWVSADDDFRVMTEFDAARSELFLARAVVLVEGLTEKLVLPFVFSALGYDADREAISIVECGGKPNIPLFVRICRATGIPFLVVHDSDRKESGRLVAAERGLNTLIAQTAGEDHVVTLDPDFEAVAGLTGRSRKPERAWKEFAERTCSDMPPELLHVAELSVSRARGE